MHSVEHQKKKNEKGANENSKKLTVIEEIETKNVMEKVPEGGSFSKKLKVKSDAVIKDETLEEEDESDEDSSNDGDSDDDSETESECESDSDSDSTCDEEEETDDESSDDEDDEGGDSNIVLYIRRLQESLKDIQDQVKEMESKGMKPEDHKFELVVKLPADMV